MWELKEMFTVSRMQHMVNIRKKNAYFVTKPFFDYLSITFRAFGVESPRGGAICMYVFIYIYIYMYIYISIIILLFFISDNIRVKIEEPAVHRSALARYRFIVAIVQLMDFDRKRVLRKLLAVTPKYCSQFLRMRLSNVQLANGV